MPPFRSQIWCLHGVWGEIRTELWYFTGRLHVGYIRQEISWIVSENIAHQKWKFLKSKLTKLSIYWMRAVRIMCNILRVYLWVKRNSPTRWLTKGENISGVGEKCDVIGSRNNFDHSFFARNANRFRRNFFRMSQTHNTVAVLEQRWRNTGGDTHEHCIQRRTASLTRNVPHTRTLPFFVRAAVWESPAETMTTWLCSSSRTTRPGSISGFESSVNRPRACSSLQPNVQTCAILQPLGPLWERN